MHPVTSEECFIEQFRLEGREYSPAPSLHKKDSKFLPRAFDGLDMFTDLVSGPASLSCIIVSSLGKWPKR